MRKQLFVFGGTVMAVLTAVPAVAAPLPPPPLVSLNVSGAPYTLTEKANPYQTPPTAEYTPVGINGTLSGTDRTAMLGSGDPECAARADALPQPAVPTSSAYCWDTVMQGKQGAENAHLMPWVPQGLATSGEAQLSGIPVTGDNRAAIVSWTWQNTKQDPVTDPENPPPPKKDYRHNSVKLAFVNLDDMKYRFVLPVWVDEAGVQRRIYGHGGGLAWYGPYLFMSSTSNWEGQPGPDAGKAGVRVFDTRKIYRKKDGGGGDYQYVLPEVRHYVSGGASFDYVSLDRNSAGGASLVGGNYRSSADSRGYAGTEVYRYRFGDDYRLNRTPVQGWKSTVPQNVGDAISDVQGVQANGDTLYFNMSKGSVANRRFSTAGVGGAASNWTLKSRKDWSYRPQDLSLWYATNELWSLTEGEEDRVLYSVKLDALK
ncbi:hypothetical protein [Streptomyces sp. BA2]|uniref:hypothetical protein n=1 Tax=Streptomyces sp. BA2 TaxID=436595 RepID=UPI0013217F62|nr:hypothetical protein [Streptomyces sp. BA2]MWA16041.1 hypothetical protein [Streptomyces sp. BA2]